MVIRRINFIAVIFIIFCSTSFYELSVLGPLQKVAEFAGIGTILVMLILNFVYAEPRPRVPSNFKWPVLMILFSVFVSMLMAYSFRNQGFSQSLFAARAIYFYLFYFLLHQLRLSTKELENLFIALGILYILLYLAQVIVYPKIIYDAYLREDRGTIRLYLAGANYMAAAFFIGVQYFLRTNKLKYLLFILVIFSMFIMNGGRQTLAIMSFVFVLFLVFDRRVKSKLFLGFLGVVGAVSLFFLFQHIFQALILQSQNDASLGDEYIRIKAARFYLTEFNKSPLAYITGNGAFHQDSNYGKEIVHNSLVHQFYLGDIGLIGNYVVYGAFFILGVLTICFRSLRKRILPDHTYIKYMFVAIMLSLLTGGAFAHPDFIVFICCALYIVDVSNYNRKTEPEKAGPANQAEQNNNHTKIQYNGV